ncbi:unnamed protein product [Symbiodinium pilosum]|uniref:Uncharacterized protein n=1 Tax=Symbiodinium pilosum TaxID=2952 RepID=A0A812QH27_SYMPI|nr:unnamed protein product [Symbiodinium pilosum]
MARVGGCLCVLLPLLVSSSHHMGHLQHQTHGSHKRHHHQHKDQQSQIEHLRKTIVKDEIAKTKFELQETRDHEAVRVMEAEAGRVGRDYGMLLAWQRHAHKAKPDAVSAKDADKAAEANLGELKMQMKQLQDGLEYAKTYVSDAEAAMENLKAKIANSSLPEEIKEAKYKYEELQKHATKATTKENAAWKTTMKREVQLGEAKEQYNKDLKQLAAEETQVRGAANKVRRC